LKKERISFRIKAEYGLDATNVGDEGGFAPNIESAEKCNKKNFLIQKFEWIILALDILVKAIDKAGYNGKIKLGMDVAASEFFCEKEKKYDLNNKEIGKPNYVNIIEIEKWIFEICVFSYQVIKWLLIILNKLNNIQ
jgi:enolase